MKTVREPLLSFAGWFLQQGFLPHILNISCGPALSPLLAIGLPLANTLLWLAITGALLEHLWPVLPISLCLHIALAGITVFIAVENGCYYNLNLEN
tara:strand:- start:282 stop:569 length:288 start_codon:yes stop_codon:yes gene_type:complete